MSILIASNISVREKWSKHIVLPEDYIVDRIIGFFEGKFNLTIISEDDSQSFEIVPNVVFLVTIDITDKCEVIIQATEEIKIDELYLILTTLPEEPADISKIKIVQHPEHGVIIAFDFTKVFAEINNDELSPEIEIRNPDNTCFFVRQSSEIFQWRDKQLYCKFTVGERRLRIKLTAIQPWSTWLQFTCMTYRKYRRSLK